VPQHAEADPQSFTRGSAILPRLVYLGDVPVEATAHGSALLYRLLQDYPPEKLRILEANVQEPAPSRRLPGVYYRRISLGWTRPLRSRFSPLWAVWLSYVALARARRIGRPLQGFGPEAVLTVHHGYSWLTAARFAARRNLALHLILHDDWNHMVALPHPWRLWLDGEFGEIYRQAASRLCVSDYMVEEYRRRYGATGTVLHPSRAKDCPKFDGPPQRLLQPPKAFTVAYAGNIFSRGYWDALRRAAEALLPMDGRLLVYSPHTRQQALANGLTTANVECRGFMRSEDLVSRLRDEADALFIPMSFEESDQENMRISFPSKLADATIPGVPLLIYGPPYCSAVRWARQNHGVAEVVDRPDPTSLGDALRRMMTHSDHRFQLGRAAIECGRKYFSHSVAVDQFWQALAKR
jgi:glycosyltransferase involved in cell wall biosynthesis